MLRLLPRTVALLLLVSAAGCQSRIAGIGQRGVHFGSTRVGAFLLPAEYRALHPKLEKLFNQPVLFDPQIDGKSIGRQLAAGHLDFAFLTPGEYVSIPEETRVELVAAGVNASGKPSRKAMIVVKATGTAAALSELKGSRFAFGPSGDLLLDDAATAALRKGGLDPKQLLLELPPLSLTGRLNVLGGSPEIAKAVAFDPLVSGGVVDEVTFDGLPATGGSLLAGPSKDQFKVLGETDAVPEIVVVAGSKADPTRVQLLREFLVAQVKSDADVCKQLGVSGFAEPSAELYADARKLKKGG